MWCNLVIWFDLQDPPFPSLNLFFFHLHDLVSHGKDKKINAERKRHRQKIHTSAAILSDPKPTTDSEGPTRLLVDYDKTHPAHGTMVDGA